MDDIRLIEKIKEGDQEAFRELFDRYNEKLYGYFFGKTKNCSLRGSDCLDVQNLSQEVWIKILENLDKFDPAETGRFYPWLWAMANNIFINAYKKALSESLHNPPLYESQYKSIVTEIVDIDSNPLKILLDEELNDEYNKELILLIQSLEDIYRKPFILYYIDDLKQSEIAEILGLSISCVKQRILRAKAMLGEGLKDLVLW